MIKEDIISFKETLILYGISLVVFFFIDAAHNQFHFPAQSFS